MARPPARVYTRRACISLLVLWCRSGSAWTKAKKTSADAPSPWSPSEMFTVILTTSSAFFSDIGLIDKQNHWTGGKTTFVQTGDLLDRGPKPREVMDLMMALEKEASQAGGRVVSLLGNHEMMNIMGDLRYVTPANYASFADGNSESRQKSAYQQYVKWRDSHGRVAGRASPADGTDRSGVDGAASPGLRRAAGSFRSQGELRQVAARACSALAEDWLCRFSCTAVSIPIWPT